MRGAFCSQCGRPTRPGARYCPDCGSLLLAGGAVLPRGAAIHGGRYRVVRLLGRGGNGAVYQVEDTRLQRACVAKELQGHFPNAAERRRAEQDFVREALILARLSTEHPGLPQVYDFFAEAGRQFLIMQYVLGLDLDQRLRTGGPLPEGEALGYGAAIADVLAFLHGQQPEPVIHRDIKPANIIVDGQARVKLVDFGLAKALPSTTSALRADAAGQTSAAGTAGYTPLEQWTLAAEARSDVYALGATLHHLLTGRDPTAAFNGLGELNLDLIRRVGSFPPLRSLRPELSPALDDLVAAMLAPEAAARPGAADVQAALAGLLKPGRSRVSPRPARRPAAAGPPPLLTVPVLDEAALLPALRRCLPQAIEGLPPDAAVEVRAARVELVPLALAGYRLAAQFPGPGGRVLHSVDATGATVLDGVTGRVLEPPVAAFVAAQRPALAPTAPDQAGSAVLAFTQSARDLRTAIQEQIITAHTQDVTYRGANGRSYTRACRPLRKHLTLEGDDPLLLHLPRWSLTLALRDQTVPVEVLQGRPAQGTAPLQVVSAPVAGSVYCAACGRFYPAAQMNTCAACGRRVCPRCTVQRSRLAIFRKPFCSAACADAFAARGSVLSWM